MIHANARRSYSSSSPNCPPASDEDPQKIFEWAKQKGAYTFTHWFSTLRGHNGEKHDTLEYPFDESHPSFSDAAFNSAVYMPNMTPSEASLKYSSQHKLLQMLQGMNQDYSKLFCGESDGSSFPSGGLRETHRAGGYTIRDASSPPFVYKNTLYLPSIFVSFCGEPLDEKTPLLRSQDAINKEGVRLLRALGDNSANGVVANLGWEQEFFIIDRDAYSKREDLIQCGRTLLGKLPHRNQQTNVHYFSRQPPRVREYLDRVRDQLWELGIPISTAHTEVAPSQYEIAPIFTMASISADQNLLAMEVMRDIAEEYDLAVLFHEKPFKGINGSGKHANWGINIRDTGENLLTPGKTKESQRRFMVMMAALTRAVDLHADMLRAVISSAGNDHRLGAHEAPPAIISLYTGDILESHIKKIIKGGELEGYSAKDESVDISVSDVHTNLRKPLEDRNRTSPLPFCSNRIEFRAVGSAQTLASPMSYLNAIMADSMNYMASEIESGKSVRDVVAHVYEKHKRVIFNGDGYSDAWIKEAESRGLPHLETTADALRTLNSAKNQDVLQRMGVLTPKGLQARSSVYYHMFNEQVLMEANCLRDMVYTGILPAALRDFRSLSRADVPGLQGIKTRKATAIENLTREIEQLDAYLSKHSTLSSVEQADYCSSHLKKQMENVREQTDELENYIDQKEYPFPKYSELIYNHHIN
eukprot:CAMPEP_0117435418 /NCGR_PEP_ID=MMETSP0759-20121206/471_1 /TAXON_ID=63605 /ORGANISM="Percolomonas cosmopolitus, Strain WS" /LENGTH=699 /DNA_ID=CAMNT_0005226965 /DNA_START=392 /DNA_END=2491 /DNA_ORIENTATION=-